MRGRIRLQPALGLLELEPASIGVTAPGLVPGDGDVDEPLEKVPLANRRRPPLVLQNLVGGEIRAGADQRHSLFEAHDFSILLFWCYIRGVATILLAGVDLFFRGKLEALLPGHRLVTTDSVDPPDMVICDIARVDPVEVVDSWPDVPILGFTNHTDKTGLQLAHTAGFDQVVVKSALVERVGEIVAELTAPSV